MEKEAILEIARMFGWETCLGHRCGGGTMANLEALWIAGRLRPGDTVVASEQAHYTHQRIGGVLGLNFETVSCDRLGRMDAAALEDRLRRGGVGTVVATMGTTASGRWIRSRRPRAAQRYGFGCTPTRLTAATCLAGNLAPEARAAYGRLAEVDSLVVDPHKHGLQPYGCGRCSSAIPPSVASTARVAVHVLPPRSYPGRDQPRCSRPERPRSLSGRPRDCRSRGAESSRADSRRAGSGARAPRAARGRSAVRDRLSSRARHPRPDTAVPSASASSDLARRVFEEAARLDLHLALAELPVKFFDLAGAGMAPDRDRITCLRSVLMKPDHREWVGRLWEILDRSTEAVLRR